MGFDAPYMYAPSSSHSGNSSRFPTATFDPKAVSRASWEPKPTRLKHEGPLVSFNKHPDAHALPPRRWGSYVPMGRYTKGAIKWLRIFQIFLRSLQLVGALGILALMILFTKLEPTASWILRITPGVATVHCIYGMYHLSRNAADRAPGSSAAYQMFSAAVDLGTLSIYAFGAFTAHKDADRWSTRLNDKSLLGYFVPAAYYGLVVVGSLHLISFSVSLWLGWAFRKISLMPPDMNPLEDHLTARPKHRRNKSYLTTSSEAESEKRFSARPDIHPTSVCEFVASPRTVPFMHTRAGSTESAAKRYSQSDLPSRQYQIVPGNRLSQQSATSIESKRESRPRSDQGLMYTELSIRDSSTEKVQYRDSIEQSRAARFSEAWSPSKSLISRTNEKRRSVATTGYSALNQRYNIEDSSDDSDGEKENRSRAQLDEMDLVSDLHPDPLRLNPTPAKKDIAGRSKTPYNLLQRPAPLTGNTLSDITPNKRQNRGSVGMGDHIAQPASQPWRSTFGDPIQSGQHFGHRYGELKPADDPVMIGSNRKVSSGNDYYNGLTSNPYERRNVSGKVAEEGRVGQ